MTTTALTATDAMTELLRLMDQRINDLEQEMSALKEKLANERTMRRALSNRVDEMERSTP